MTPSFWAVSRYGSSRFPAAPYKAGSWPYISFFPLPLKPGKLLPGPQGHNGLFPLLGPQRISPASPSLRPGSWWPCTVPSSTRPDISSAPGRKRPGIHLPQSFELFPRQRRAYGLRGDHIALPQGISPPKGSQHRTPTRTLPRSSGGILYWKTRSTLVTERSMITSA